MKRKSDLGLYDTVNPAIPGFLIFTFEKIRKIQFSELLQDHNLNEIGFDPNIAFYLDRLGDFESTKDLNLHRANRVRNLAKHYAICELFYTNKMTSKIESEIKQASYDYVLIAEVEDIVKSFHNARLKFTRITGNGTFCKIKDVAKILAIHKEHYLWEEMGVLTHG
ncbi:MAG: hypothetical protein AAF518_16275 [Spirochaetota bacterium]